MYREARQRNQLVTHQHLPQMFLSGGELEHERILQAWRDPRGKAAVYATRDLGDGVYFGAITGGGFVGAHGWGLFHQDNLRSPPSSTPLVGLPRWEVEEIELVWKIA